MHKIVLFSAALVLVVVAIKTPTALTFMSCTLLAVLMVAAYRTLYAIFEPKMREHPKGVVNFLAGSVVTLVILLGAYDVLLDSVMHILTEPLLFIGFALMASATGICCGGVVCVLRLDRDRRVLSHH
jgi:hypothetical protein